MTYAGLLPTPITDKYSMSLEDDKVRVGVSSMQGWRPTMEDAHIVALDLPNLKGDRRPDEGAMFGVFDGHCGPKIAQVAASKVIQWVTDRDEFKKGNYNAALAKAFIRGDAWMHDEHPTEQSGCTANVVTMVGNTLLCANAGDSRAILCRAGRVVELSEDHKPTKKTELERIIRAGGFVSPAGRIFGVLALSRAMGDYMFKKNEDLAPEEQVVTANPEIREFTIQQNDDFIVIACDGIWDCMSNDDVLNFVRDELNNHGDVCLAAERLLEACLSPTTAGMGTDNMTAIVIQFKSDFLRDVAIPPPPRPPPEAPPGEGGNGGGASDAQSPVSVPQTNSSG